MELSWSASWIRLNGRTGHGCPGKVQQTEELISNETSPPPPHPTPAAQSLGDAVLGHVPCPALRGLEPVGHLQTQQFKDTLALFSFHFEALSSDQTWACNSRRAALPRSGRNGSFPALHRRDRFLIREASGSRGDTGVTPPSFVWVVSLNSFKRPLLCLPACQDLSTSHQ